MKIQTIASGSKGNCSIILCEETKIIIDMGISFLTLKRCLEENSLSFSDFDAILITHNHKDHTKGLSTLINKTNLQLYIPEAMYDGLKELVPYPKCNFIEDEFLINDVEIELIHTSHDAPYSVGYIIKHNNKKMVYVTDTGYINRKYLKKMENCDLYLIESNHDEVMFMEGPYPRYLESITGTKTKNIILAHISEKNNTKEKEIKEIDNSNINKNINIYIADQYEPGPIIEV